MEQPSKRGAAPICGVGFRPLCFVQMPGVGWGQNEVHGTDGGTEAQCGELSCPGSCGSALQREVPRTAFLFPQPGDRLPPGCAGVSGAGAGPGGAAPPPLSAAAAA